MSANLQPRPVLGPPALWRFPEIIQTYLTNGIRVLEVNLPGKLVATVSVLLDVPVDSDPKGLEGLAIIAARCLDEGTQSLGAEEFADALERQGASFHASAGYDGITATLEVPVSRMATALPLLADAVRVPAFPANEVDRVLKQRLAELTQEQASPPGRANLEFTALLYPKGSRHGISGAGNAESIAALTPDVVAAGYRARVAAASTTIVVAGDVAAIDVTALLQAAFGDWDATSELWSPTTPTYDGTRRALVVDRPGSAQTQLVIGHAGIDRSAPDWAATGLAGYALGGTLTSRIDAVLREEKGYTYGMRAGFGPLRRGGSFTINGSVDTGNTQPALEDLMAVLRTANADGLREDELVAAREYLVGVSPMRWETPSAVAAQISAVVGNDLPLSWIDSYLDGLRTATLADLTQALRTHVRLEDLLVVAVGEAEAITGPLEELGFGPAEVVAA